MIDQHRKAMIFAPFWGQPGHVGNHRVDRFVRWLAEDGYAVVIVRAGDADGEHVQPWGQEITIRDSLGLYRNNSSGAGHASPRKPNKLRRWLAYWLFNPDPTIIWAKTAAKHPKVLSAMQGAQFILSSSPPESVHVGAWLLSRRSSVPQIVDMRDGWLDEPLKQLLRYSHFRRWREGRLEACILKHAKVIQVTSKVWKDLLCARYPALADRVHVLTNGYPQQIIAPQSDSTKSGNEERLLVHAGRFLGSRMTQLPNLLLAPLLENLRSQPSTGLIELLGPLSNEEIKIIERFKPGFREIGWRIECPGSLPRDKLLKRLQEADGLLLLSASFAALPSKLFEYISTHKPIFAVTKKNSAVWDLCSFLPQAKIIEAGYERTAGNGLHEKPFYQNRQYDVPVQYSESALKASFIDNVRKLEPFSRKFNGLTECRHT
jgi:hypothetical protein